MTVCAQIVGICRNKGGVPNFVCQSGAGYPWPSQLENWIARDLSKCAKVVTELIIPKSL